MLCSTLIYSSLRCRAERVQPRWRFSILVLAKTGRPAAVIACCLNIVDSCLPVVARRP